MRVLIIYPNKSMTTRVPLGLGYISAYLKDAGHEFMLFDTTFMKCSDNKSDDKLREENLQVTNPDFLKYNLVEENVNVFEELTHMVTKFKPDIIGVSVVDSNYKFGMELLRFCKKSWNNIPTMCGGAIATLVPDEVIAENCVDIVAIGEVEQQLVKYLSYCESEETRRISMPNFWIKTLEGKIIKRYDHELPDISKGLPPDLSIFDDRHFIRPLGGRMYRMATVIWTRGCLFHCSYCANELFYHTMNVSAKQYYRRKDTSLLIDELAQFKKQFNLNFIMFVDDIFPLHNVEIMKEFNILYKEKVNLPFSINVQPMIVNEKSFQLAVDAGLKNVCCGIESGNERIRREVLKRNYKDEDVIKVFDLAHKYNIRSSSFNIIGLPSETRNDIMDTVELNRKANPNSATVTFFHPYRGCELRKTCIKQGLVKSEEDLYEDVYRQNSHLSMSQISKKELEGLMASFQLYVKLPKEYYNLIRMQEDQTNLDAKLIREKILLPKFKEIIAI